MTRDRRVQVRKTPTELGFIQIQQDEGGKILNLSDSGLCFETFAPIEGERRLQFWFSLDLRERIEATGRLAWLGADRRVGGLEFFELSARARRHLHAYLGNEPHIGVGTTNGPERSSKSEPFSAALAKPSLREATPKLQLHKTAVTAVSGDNGSCGPLVEQGKVFSSSMNLMSLVSLERHVSDARRQLLRGMVLGATVSLAVGLTAGWYFGRKYQGSAPVPAVAAPADAGASLTPAQTSEAPTTPSPATHPMVRQSPEPRSPDNPPLDGEPLRHLSTSSTARAQGAGTQSYGGEAKAVKKSHMTLQMLWAAVQAGNAKAMVELADHYLQGDGVPVNCDQARVLLLVASEKNNADAIKELHDLDKTGCPGEKEK